MLRALDGEEGNLVIADDSPGSPDIGAALTLLRDEGHDIPVIVVSSRGDEEKAWALLEAGTRDYLGPDQLGRLTRMKEMKSWSRDTENVRHDGTAFPVRLLSDVVTDAAGKPVAVVTTCEDISERKQAEEALRVAEERYCSSPTASASPLGLPRRKRPKNCTRCGDRRTRTCIGKKL